jgi:uncharacterized protein YndB with AHSA1/START domain
MNDLRLGSPSGLEYQRELALSAPVARVFDAIATEEGVRGWWSTDVTGSAAVGDVLRFGFTLPTHAEWIVMRVDAAVRTSLVRWTCVAQYVAPVGLSKHDEWVGTEVNFRLTPTGPSTCALEFSHVGLTPALECYSVCSNGWDYFLASLVSLVERGAGDPYGR